MLFFWRFVEWADPNYSCHLYAKRWTGLDGTQLLCLH